MPKPQRRRFNGPIGIAGPDWNEPCEKFDPDHLRRFCGNSSRVREYLARLDGDEGREEVAEVREEIMSLRGEVVALQEAQRKAVARLAEQAAERRETAEDLRRGPRHGENLPGYG